MKKKKKLQKMKMVWSFSSCSLSTSKIFSWPFFLVKKFLGLFLVRGFEFFLFEKEFFYFYLYLSYIISCFSLWSLYHTWPPLRWFLRFRRLLWHVMKWPYLGRYFHPLKILPLFWNLFSLSSSMVFPNLSIPQTPNLIWHVLIIKKLLVVQKITEIKNIFF